MSLFSLLPKLLGTIAQVAGIDVQPVLNALGSMPADKRAELEQAVMKHEEEMGKLDLESLKALVSESIAATQSDDKWVRRARPSLLYLAGLITAALAIGAMFGIKFDTGLIAELILPLYGNAAWYTYNRTKEKTSGQ